MSQAERDKLRNAILELDQRSYPDGVSFWDKQDQIHQATHVHGGPAFIPWHRELVNRYEALLRQIANATLQRAQAQHFRVSESLASSRGVPSP